MKRVCNKNRMLPVSTVLVRTILIESETQITLRDWLVLQDPHVRSPRRVCTSTGRTIRNVY